MPLTDQWSGFADLMANLIEKYAAILDIEHLAEPQNSGEKMIGTFESKQNEKYNDRKRNVQTGSEEKSNA